MDTPLATRKCTPCSGDDTPLRGAELTTHMKMVADRWELTDEHHIEAEFGFDNFQKALDFTVAVGALAEEEGHHPNICLTWGQASVKIWTHAIDGLSVNDFILAAKIDRVVD